MQVTEVRVKLATPGENPSLLAYCSVTFDDLLAVRDVRVIRGRKGTVFIAFPTRDVSDHCTACAARNPLTSLYCGKCGQHRGHWNERGRLKLLDGRVKLFADIIYPINQTGRDMIESAILEAYHEEERKSKLPGYVPTSDQGPLPINYSREKSDEPS